MLHKGTLRIGILRLTNYSLPDSLPSKPLVLLRKNQLLKTLSTSLNWNFFYSSNVFVFVIAVVGTEFQDSLGLADLWSKWFWVWSFYFCLEYNLLKTTCLLDVLLEGDLVFISSRSGNHAKGIFFTHCLVFIVTLILYNLK